MGESWTGCRIGHHYVKYELLCERGKTGRMPYRLEDHGILRELNAAITKHYRVADFVLSTVGGKKFRRKWLQFVRLEVQLWDPCF